MVSQESAKIQIHWHLKEATTRVCVYCKNTILFEFLIHMVAHKFSLPCYFPFMFQSTAGLLLSHSTEPAGTDPVNASPLMQVTPEDP